MSGTKGDHPDGFTAIILAAGQGTRMRSQRPKVLHEIAGLAMLGHLLTSVRAAGATTVCVVTSPQQDDVRSFVAGHDARATTVVQEAQRGTADAVLAARSVLETVGEPVLVLAGDVPLVTPETLQATARRIREGADVVVVGFTAADPTGYGRLICDASGMLRAIVEHADASAQERAITLCNSGFIGIDGEKTLTLLDDIGNDNAQGEFYLTDVVAIARARGGDAVVYEAPADDVRGVNSRAQLAEVEAIWQARRRRTLMEEGVSMAAPATVHLTHDTQIAPDAFIAPDRFI
ncbi:MAG: NTP transferase domain-containing protein, partial [Pseudomonadota bacterium]